MKLSSLNDNTYFQTVGTSSNSITLTAADKLIAVPVAVITNTGSASIFAVAGSGSPPTAVFPTSSTVPVPGKIIAAGSTVSYQLPPGTSHISFISSAAGNAVGISIGSGV